MTDLTKIINEQRDRIAELEKENISLRSGVKGDLLRLYKDEKFRAKIAERERNEFAYYPKLCNC